MKRMMSELEVAKAAVIQGAVDGVYTAAGVSTRGVYLPRLIQSRQ